MEETKEFKAFLKKKEGQDFLILELDKEDLYISLNEKDQKNLPDIFKKIISHTFDEKFKFVFSKSSELDDFSLNEVCEEYIEMLNNDLENIFNNKDKELSITEK